MSDRLNGRRLESRAPESSQLPLFPTDDLIAPGAVAHPTLRPRLEPIRRSRHVLHDPAVAESVVRRDRLGTDLRSAFVSFWAGLSPERRAEIRSRLGGASQAA